MVIKGIQGSIMDARVFKDIQWCTGLFKGIQWYTEYSRVYKGIQTYKLVYRGIHGYTGEVKCIRGYTGVIKGIQGILGKYCNSFQMSVQLLIDVYRFIYFFIFLTLM